MKTLATTNSDGYMIESIDLHMGKCSNLVGRVTL